MSALETWRDEPTPVTDTGDDVWLTAAEIAELGLAGLPGTKRKVNELAAEQGWALKQTRGGAALSRPRAGRGGGVEYHASVLPPAAALDLARRAQPANDIAAPAPGDSREALWAWYARQSAPTKAEAARRLACVERVEQLARTLSRSAAVAAAAASFEVSAATVWTWLERIAGVRRDDRLPNLAPRRQGGGREVEVHPDLWRAFRSDLLRLEKPPAAAVYERVKVAAARERWGAVPSLKTLMRKLKREVDPLLQRRLTGGSEAVRTSAPPLTRSVANLHALQAVNIDGHQWDVFVEWPGRAAPMRPMMVAIQDVYSRKILSWRIAESECAATVQLAFADCFRDFGVPERCYFDNGRAFGSKWITGGAPYRFRGKVLPSDPLGLMGSLGIEVCWTTPYRGQSKPIERAFGDLERHVGTHPAFAGAATGNRPDRKPVNYGSKAVPLDVFREVVAAGIAAHNAREGRSTETARVAGAKGRSFDQVFAESYAAHPVPRASPEQLRMALLPAEKVTGDRRTGAVSLFGNTYWTDASLNLAGRKLTARFDPDQLHGEVHLYDLTTGAFLLTAPVYEAAGFADREAARTRAKLVSRRNRAAKDLEASEGLLAQPELADLLRLPEPSERVGRPAVVRLVRQANGSPLTMINGTTDSDADAPEPSANGDSGAFFDRFADRFATARGGAAEVRPKRSGLRLVD